MAQLDIDDPLYEKPVDTKPKRHREPFVQISHRSLIEGAAVLHSARQFLVWTYIHYLVWQEKQRTVAVSNGGLDAWGVGRKTKYAALRLLEGAGLITIEWRHSQSPKVTLLPGWPT
jgi:hypothetical protein